MPVTCQRSGHRAHGDISSSRPNHGDKICGNSKGRDPGNSKGSDPENRRVPSFGDVPFRSVHRCRDRITCNGLKITCDGPRA